MNKVTGKCDGPGSIFLAGEYVYSWIDLGNVLKPHEMQWQWMDVGNKTFREDRFTFCSKSNCGRDQVWDYLAPDSGLGSWNWSVRVSVDGIPLFRDSFMITTLKWETFTTLSYQWQSTYRVPAWYERALEGNVTNPAQVVLSTDASTVAILTRSQQLTLLNKNGTIFSEPDHGAPSGAFLFPVTAVSLSPSGNVSAVSYLSAPNLAQFAVYSRNGTRTYAGGKGSNLGCVAINPRGDVAYQSDIDEISFMSDGNVEWTFHIPAGPSGLGGLPDIHISALQFSEDGNILLVAGRVWSLLGKTAKPNFRDYMFLLDLYGKTIHKYTFPADVGGFRNAAFSATEKRIVALSSNGTLYFLSWDGTVFWRKYVGFWYYDGFMSSPLAMSEDGAYVAYATNTTLNILSPNRLLIGQISHASVRSLSFQRGYLAFSNAGNAEVLSFWKPVDSALASADQAMSVFKSIDGNATNSEAYTHFHNAANYARRYLWYDAFIEAQDATKLADEGSELIVSRTLSDVTSLAKLSSNVTEPSAIELARQGNSSLNSAEAELKTKNYELAMKDLMEAKMLFTRALSTRSSPQVSVSPLPIIALVTGAIVVLVILFGLKRRPAGS